MKFLYCPECGTRLSEKEQQNEYCTTCHEDFSYDDVDIEDERERYLEQREEEMAMLAASCKCGAWQFAKDGRVIHVADCCCGAE